MFGSLLGMWFPGLALLAASPPLGWETVGGREPLSLFALEASRPSPSLPNEALLLTDYPCPGETGFRRLEASPLPEEGTRLPYEPLVACVRAAPNGRVVRVWIMDAQGKAVKEPTLATYILSTWRFEVKAGQSENNQWQRIRLDTLMVGQLAARSFLFM